MRSIRKLVLLMLFVTSEIASGRSVPEPRTGICFDDTVQNLKLEKLGVRTLGPVKIYAVGQYGKSNPKNPNNYAFVLKMNIHVRSGKLSSVLMDAIKPRCEKLGCYPHQDRAFKDMVLHALPPEGAKVGTTLIFSTSGNKVTLTVDGKQSGKISGSAIAKAFAGIYTDSNAVCSMKSIHDEGETTESSTSWLFLDYFNMDTFGIASATILALVAIYLTNSSQHGRSSKIMGITELNIYPIKSCAEQSVDSIIVTKRGFQGDRIAMVVDSDKVCCTSRDSDKVKLFHIEPKISLPDCNTMTVAYKGDRKALLNVNLKSADISSSIPCSHNEAPGKILLSDLGNAAASWIEQATGIQGCRLMGIVNDRYNEKGSYQRHCMINPGQGDAIPTKNGEDAPVSLADEAPFLITSLSSLNDLNQRLQKRGIIPVDMRRFRPNIVVNASPPWIEDTWKKIRIGKVEFFVWQKCGRCTMTTIDRDSLVRAPKGEPLSTLNTFREGQKGQRNFGMHLIPDPATLEFSDDLLTIHVGDTIEVLEVDEERLQEWQKRFSQ